jgi:hypothetical protein
MNRNKGKIVVLVVLAVLLGSGIAFGRAGLGNSFMRAFGMTPTGGGGTGTGDGTPLTASLSTGLSSITTISIQQILPTFTPYTYGYGAGRF